MTRECSSDFFKIKGYIEGYSISSSLSNDGFVSSLRVMHKCYFGAITWNAEMVHNKDLFLKLDPRGNDDIVFRIAEVVSDLGSALFNWANGNYKVCRVMLRVAIENFVRAVSSLEDKDQLTEKNVYDLFDKALKQKDFSNNALLLRILQGLHGDYKLLCQDAHTASIQNMQHLSSLEDLPTFSKSKSKSSSKVYVRVSKNITSFFCVLFNAFYHKMHYRNKENVLESISREVRPFLSFKE